MSIASTRVNPLRCASSRKALGSACLAVMLLAIHPAKSDAQEPVSSGGVADAISREALERKLASVRAQATAPATSEQAGDNRRVSPEAAMLSNSLLLGNKESYVILPLGSVLHLPAAHREKLLSQPAGGFLNWADFLSRNREWLATREVTLAMARGEEPKKTAALSREFQNEGRAVVAVIQGNPVSMMEPAAPQAGSSPSAGGRK